MNNQVASARTTALRDFSVWVATSEEELAEVDGLWRDVYGRERHWLDPEQHGELYRDRYHAHSTYLVASADDRAIGTMRLVSNSDERLPVQQFMSPDALTRRMRVIECQRLMVRADYRKRRDERTCPFGVFASLIKATLHHCLRNRVTHVVADLFTDTDTTPMGQLGALGFRQLGEPFVDFELSEKSTSVALMLEIADLLSAAFRHKEPFHRYLVTPDDAFLAERPAFSAAL
jgi:hypothetical protein